jgi:L-arabinonolactonase
VLITSKWVASVALQGVKRLMFCHGCNRALMIEVSERIKLKTPITCVAKSNDSLGEGCLWDAVRGALWWLDIARPTRIHQLVPATGYHRSWYSDVMLTAIALRGDGSLVAGGSGGIYFFDPETGALQHFCDPETDRPHNRFNDGVCDSAGRMWIGTMHENIGPRGEDLPIPASTGALYCVLPDGSSRLVFDAVGVSNGPCWSPDDGTFYFSDSKAQIIWAFDFDARAGDITNKRVFNDSKDHGYPDGATVDADGFVWSARWDASCVLRIDPKGRIDRVVKMPAKRPTCVVFGGPMLDVIYVTSSRAHLPRDEIAARPLNGGVFCFDPGVKGFLKNRFAG